MDSVERLGETTRAVDVVAAAEPSWREDAEPVHPPSKNGSASTAAKAPRLTGPPRAATIERRARRSAGVLAENRRAEHVQADAADVQGAPVEGLQIEVVAALGPRVVTQL
jgi:hypothetical protein